MAENAEVLTVRQGVYRTFQIGPLTDDAGDLVTAFTPADVPSCAIWPGDGEPAVDSPAVTWLSTAAPAYLSLAIAASDTRALAVQPYPMVVTILHAGQALEAWSGWLDVLPGPGSASALPTYGTFADMLFYCDGAPWLKELLIASGDTSGFLAQRARARSRLEEVILARYRPRRMGAFVDISLGSAGWWPPDAPSPILMGYLAANGLIVRPKVVEICARLAIAYACTADVGGSGDSSPYLMQGRMNRCAADRLIRSYVAEVDINADGVADLTIDCGVINTRSVY